MRVIGKQIFHLGKQVDFCSLTTWPPDIFEVNWRRFYTADLFRYIKSLGFNTVIVRFKWCHIEETPGVYTATQLEDIDRVIQWCKDAGLWVIIDIVIRETPHHLCPSSSCAASINYLINDPDATQRYQQYLSMIVQRYTPYSHVIGFNGWSYPFHGYTGMWDDPAWKESYYNTWTPLIVSTIRAHSNKIIFYCPYRQGAGGPNSDEYSDTWQFTELTPLADKNVVYGHSFHSGRSPSGGSHRAAENGLPWDYDEAYIRQQIQPAQDFSNKYNVPTMVWEWALQNVEPPIDQSRLDLVEYKLNLLAEARSPWTYDGLRCGSGVGCWWGSSGNVEGDCQPNAVLKLLENYTPKPPLAKILGTISTGLISLWYALT